MKNSGLPTRTANRAFAVIISAYVLSHFMYVCLSTRAAPNTWLWGWKTAAASTSLLLLTLQGVLTQPSALQELDREWVLASLLAISNLIMLASPWIYSRFRRGKTDARIYKYVIISAAVPIVGFWWFRNTMKSVSDFQVGFYLWGLSVLGMGGFFWLL